jgi:glucokinase
MILGQRSVFQVICSNGRRSCLNVKIYPMTNPEVIGIDLGGTAIKLGRFTQDGTCTKSLTIPTPQPSTPEAVLDTMVYAIGKIAPGVKNIVAIGVGTPGPADASGRIAKIAINLEGWRDIPLAGLLMKKTGVSAIVANDANCAALGEAWLGAARHYRHCAMLTLGTGVGGAIIIDGKLYTGAYGSAGELGLITLNAEGPPCNSGNNGSLEQYLSVPAVRRMTGKDPKEIAELADRGDRDALKFWRKYGRNLGVGLTSIIYILTPEAVIIGGGISASAKYFLPEAEREIQKRVMSTSREGIKLIPAELGNTAGMLGAAKLAWDKLVRS